jgi:hypothetical protein
VLVIEDADRVSIGLVRRVVECEAPNGMAYGESLQMGGRASLDVALSQSLGTRSLLDASTGEVVPRVERRSDDRMPGEGEWAHLYGAGPDTARLRFPCNDTLRVCPGARLKITTAFRLVPVVSTNTGGA